MRANRFRSIPLVILTLFIAMTASGQATRTWVSGVGDDANPCSRTAPCKTFAGAISKTASPGEIDALDPGGYGSVTITKSVTIDGGSGQVASVLASGTTGIYIVAGNSDTVILRNIGINGAGTTSGIDGIRVISAGSVHIEHCEIMGFSNRAINIVTTTPNSEVIVSDTVIRNNTEGIGSFPGSGGSVFLTLRNVESTHNVGHGVDIYAYTNLNATDCLMTNNGASGVLAWGPTDDASLEHCTLSGNNYGVYAGYPPGSASTIRLSNCLVTGNTVSGVLLNGGTVSGYHNNTIDGNVSGNSVSVSLSQQ